MCGIVCVWGRELVGLVHVGNASVVFSLEVRKHRDVGCLDAAVYLEDTYRLVKRHGRHVGG